MKNDEYMDMYRVTYNGKINEFFADEVVRVDEGFHFMLNDEEVAFFRLTAETQFSYCISHIPAMTKLDMDLK